MISSTESDPPSSVYFAYFSKMAPAKPRAVDCSSTSDLATTLEKCDAVEILLQHHASPLLIGDRGLAPLHWNARNQSITCVRVTRILIERGANVNQLNNRDSMFFTLPSQAAITQRKRFSTYGCIAAQICVQLMRTVVPYYIRRSMTGF